jgi:phosphonopyruvate decarboxylase
MTASDAASKMLSDSGIRLVAGVPCSLLNGLIDALEANPLIRYVSAANEGDAVAIAVGAGLAGCPAAVLMQNSGLGNAVNPLTSLSSAFALPLLMIVGWRGGPDEPDEPQHELMGDITPSLLRLCGAQVIIGKRGTELSAISAGATYYRAGGIAAVLIDSNSLKRSKASPATKRSERDPEAIVHDLRSGNVPPSRTAVLKTICDVIDDSTAVIATTGYCARELMDTLDRPSHLYQVGSMGCASSIGLGISLCSKRATVVLDGDGAAVMRLGALSAIGAEYPTGFTHVLLDNGCHASTGGQRTAARKTDFSAVAAACGYASIYRCDSVSGFQLALTNTKATPTPRMIHVEISGCSSTTSGRPQISPIQNAARFITWMTGQ